MNVTITPQLDAMIRQKVERGLYPTASDVVLAALRLMEERDRGLQTLRAAVAVGVEQIERGETVPYTSELMERLKHEAEEDARQGKPIDDAVTA